MFKRLFRLAVSVAGGVALARYIRSDQGRATVDRALGVARDYGRKALQAATAPTPTPAEGGTGIETRIEEAQQRLRGQMHGYEEGTGKGSDETA